MVILQGSLLDRIDFNIEESYQKVVEGAEHIEKAEKYQKKASGCAFKTMIFFLIGIAIMSIVLAIKWSKKE
jgi:t-SNARE complex subunit (syntaxin)